MSSAAKTGWTRAERTLLLRAWREVVETHSTAARGETSKADVTAHVFRRFAELVSGECQRSRSAMEIQKVILLYNYTFVTQYNAVHGANAWSKLILDARAEVFGRERTSSYNFVDLDQDMMDALASIQSHTTTTTVNGSGSNSVKATPKRRRPARLKTAGTTRLKTAGTTRLKTAGTTRLKTTGAARPKPTERMSANDAAFRAIAEQRSSVASTTAGDSEECSSSSSELGSDDNETVKLADQTAVAAPVKRPRRADPNVQVSKTELASILTTQQKLTRHIELLLAGKRRRHGAHRLSASSVVVSARDVGSVDGRRQSLLEHPQ